MRTILVLLLSLTIAFCNANRAKRLSALRVASISGGDVLNFAKIGQSKGCVVTGNKLYVNGIYLRELNLDEMDEVKVYQAEAAEYKKVYRYICSKSRLILLRFIYLQELQAAMLKQAESLEDISSFFTGNIAKVKFPETPKKPSFCSEELTKQTILDGCVVQNNKVYIGSEYARDLNSEEIEQLNEYEKKMKVYEIAVSEQVKEVKTEFFIMLLRRLKAFNLSTSKILGQLTSPPSSPSTLRRTSPAATTETLVAPVAPNFCVTVY
uniref:Pepsin-I3 domain-containing protein n=1 Tax=Syphacia muris TaxID=451379 RepID=A0A0N5ARB0_9BILA